MGLSFFFFNICLTEVHTDTPILSHFTFYKRLWGLHEYIVKTTRQSGTMQKWESFQGHQNIPNLPLSSGPFSFVFPIRLSMRLIVHSSWVHPFLCICHHISSFNCTPQGQSKAHSPLKLAVPVSHFWNHPIKVTRFSTAAAVIRLLPMMRGLNHRDLCAAVLLWHGGCLELMILNETMRVNELAVFVCRRLQWQFKTMRVAKHCTHCLSGGQLIHLYEAPSHRTERFSGF